MAENTTPDNDQIPDFICGPDDDPQNFPAGSEDDDDDENAPASPALIAMLGFDPDEAE